MSSPSPKTALDTSTLSLSPSQVPVLRTILSCASSKTRIHLSTSSWFAFEIVYWSLNSTRDKKNEPEFRVFETFEGEVPKGGTNDEMHFSAKCEGNKLEILASKVVKEEVGDVPGGESECKGEGKMSIAFIALIPVKPECVQQAKDFITGPYAACVRAETCTRYWYAFQRDATTLGLFGTWANEEELKEHMEGGAVDMLDKGLEPFMSGPFDRRKGSMIAYRI